MKCPLCESEVDIVMKFDKTQPVYCKHCDKIWIANGDQIVTNETIKIGGKLITQDSNVLPISLRSRVYVDCREHQMFLEQGVVVEKEAQHYRVKLRSLNKAVDNKCLWFPEHWIKVLPEEM